MDGSSWVRIMISDHAWYRASRAPICKEGTQLYQLFLFSTPPSRTAKFEEFKQEKGVEINRILVENKEILASKKKAYADLAKQINTSKIDIDASRDKLERLKEEREANGVWISTIWQYVNLELKIHFSLKLL